MSLVLLARRVRPCRSGTVTCRAPPVRIAAATSPSRNRSATENAASVRRRAAGLTLRAGGFPQVYLMFAWGGHEGTHTIAAVNTSLLGGSSRPSLY